MTTMKLRLGLLVSSLVLATMMLVACGDNTAAPTTTAATTGPATTAAATTTNSTTAAAATTAAPAQTTVATLPTATPLPATTAPAVTTQIPLDPGIGNGTTATPAGTTAAATTAVATTAAPTTAAATTQAATTAAPTTTAATTAAATTAANGQTVPVSVNPADVNKDLFIDDRSNPLQVLRSFYNAINRKEYVRAYSYWTTGAAGLPTYAQFEAGYKDTVTVQFYYGQLTGGAGAGNRYYGVPFSIKATDASGKATVFAGCYTVHLAEPANFGQPPIQPMSIDKGTVQPVQGSATAADLMAKSCQDTAGQPYTVASVPANDSAVGKDFYLDDRSTPESVIRSFYNAINRKEYVRAYSYFRDQATGVPAYPQFADGYKNTASVQLTLGTVTSDAGAGTINYQLPVKLTVTQADGSTQNFTGTYTLRKAQPANFGQPPFVPLGIAGADIK